MFGVVKRFKVYNFLIVFNEGVTRLHVRFGSTRTMRFNLSLIDQFYFNYIYIFKKSPFFVMSGQIMQIFYKL